MKIGILTLPFNNNYGGYLQAYALLSVLKGKGHDVELIYRRHNRISIRKKIIPALKNIIKMILGRKVVSIFPDEEKCFRAHGASMMRFLDEKITPKSKPLYSSKDFNKYVSGRYDAVIVGSDQVWRPEYGPGIRDFFLCGIFDKDLIRLSYAASFGTDSPLYTKEERKDCGIALSKFNAISVREESGLTLIKGLTTGLKTEPELVLDPTLLLTDCDYADIIKNEINPNKGCVFCYVLNLTPSVDTIITEVCANLNLPSFIIGNIQSAEASLPSVEFWLSTIKNANFVITDSYHGMVFSIIMQKPFIVKVNHNRGTDRFVSFLSKLGLEQRIVNSEYDIQNALNFVIDWNRVGKILEQERQKSLVFLEKNLA